ncbi:alanine racemase [Rivularia sp. IAM M-261]|nr:alanine racemase [Calothrix sp. PCC 7716]GJD23492.1 alanine racemase [Rivularia sp. IAM M-261]
MDMLSNEQFLGIAHQERDTYSWMQQRAWVEIDLGAVEHNVKQLKKLLVPQTQLMAVVKADAYGHGAVTIAKVALSSGASWLGVATVPEGIQLREAGITAPILLLGAAQTFEQIHAIANWQLQPTLCSPRQALVFSNTLEAINYNSSLPVHIKLDTGMSRLGTNWQESGEFVKLVTRLPRLRIASIYSHLATADSPDSTIMNLQHERFEAAIAQIKASGITIPSLHFANSAATLVSKKLHYDMVRVGLAIYGHYPAEHLHNVNLKPVLQVKARVTQVKTIEAGTGVSYGYKYVASRNMRIAVVGIGYADGIPRNLSNKMQVIIRGQRVPQIGAITMDQIMLDISSIPDIQENEIVTILGKDQNEQITADDWANELNTISWEILCSFKHRLPRVAIR